MPISPAIVRNLQVGIRVQLCSYAIGVAAAQHYLLSDKTIHMLSRSQKLFAYAALIYTCLRFGSVILRLIGKACCVELRSGYDYSWIYCSILFDVGYAIGFILRWTRPDMQHLYLFSFLEAAAIACFLAYLRKTGRAVGDAAVTSHVERAIAYGACLIGAVTLLIAIRVATGETVRGVFADGLFLLALSLSVLGWLLYYVYVMVRVLGLKPRLDVDFE